MTKGLTDAERRALSIIRENPEIEGGHGFARLMWPGSAHMTFAAAQPILGRLYERGFVERTHRSRWGSGDKGCNVYRITEIGALALALTKREAGG